MFFLGAFNIKMNNIIDYNTQNFNKHLHNFNLSQHVSFPTHDSSYILDLIVTNDSSKLNIHPFYFDTCISDHKTNYVDLNFTIPPIEKKTFSYRQINNFTFNQFNQDISVAFPNFELFDLNSLVNYYNSTPSFVLNKINMLH